MTRMAEVLGLELQASKEVVKEVVVEQKIEDFAGQMKLKEEDVMTKVEVPGLQLVLAEVKEVTTALSEDGDKIWKDNKKDDVVNVAVQSKKTEVVEEQNTGKGSESDVNGIESPKQNDNKVETNKDLESKMKGDSGKEIVDLTKDNTESATVTEQMEPYPQILQPQPLAYPQAVSGSEPAHPSLGLLAQVTFLYFLPRVFHSPLLSPAMPFEIFLS